MTVPVAADGVTDAVNVTSSIAGAADQSDSSSTDVCTFVTNCSTMSVLGA